MSDVLHQGRKEELAAEARLLREDAHRVALDRAERAQRAAALRAKFGALRCKHAGAADEDGQPRSQVRTAHCPRILCLVQAKCCHSALCLYCVTMLFRTEIQATTSEPACDPAKH